MSAIEHNGIGVGDDVEIIETKQCGLVIDIDIKKGTEEVLFSGFEGSKYLVFWIDTKKLKIITSRRWWRKERIEENVIKSSNIKTEINNKHIQKPLVKSTKQVIVVRKDLNMRKGKIAAQCCHASMAFMSRDCGFYCDHFPKLSFHIRSGSIPEEHMFAVRNWFRDSFKKVVVYVNSEEGLMEIYNKAKKRFQLGEQQTPLVNLIIDNGDTEFKGVPTKTCVAIGPCFDDMFVGLTDHLPLL